MTLNEAEFRRMLQNNPNLRAREYSGRKEPPADRQLLRREDFDSEAEYRFYQKRVIPGLITGHIVSVDAHKEFEVIEAVEYRGRRYQRRVYTPDFIVSYRDGSVDAVEIKNKQVKKMQRDYPLRRQIFIIKFCIPNNWLFLEVMDNEI